MSHDICFITPPSPFLLDERVFPTLGILKVAAMTERAGYSVAHLDLNGVANYGDAIDDYCRRNPPEIFAITATTPQMVAVTKIRACIRELLPNVKIILGGAHPTLTHAATKHSERARLALNILLRDYDVVVAGDGELAIGEALTGYGLIDADDPKGSLFLTNQAFADLPLPARHLIDLGSYHYFIDGVMVTSEVTQLGCPFGCHFCAGRDSAMLRRVRLRPTAAVIAEMRFIYETYGIHGFMFFDDELNVNPKFLELLVAMDRFQQDIGVELRCRGFVKAELFTDAQGAAMYRAGFRKVLCGFESGSDRILRNINKNATKADNTRAMEISHKHGLGMKALMSVGHPGESAATVRATQEWLLAVKPDDFDCTIITAYPGSPYYDRASKVAADTWVFEVNGDRLYMLDIDYTQVEDFYKGALDSYRSYVWTDDISAADLVTARNDLENTVRTALGIPFYQAAAPIKFEASMGMLPGRAYRKAE